MKPICVVDACSYIYLSQVEINNKGGRNSLFQILANQVTIKYSQEVNRELVRNALDNNTALQRSTYIYNFKKYKLDDYDNYLFDGRLEDLKDDKGEHENICVAIDIFFDKFSRLYFLSDDKKAVGDYFQPKKEGHLKELLDTFPYFNLWTSYDAIIFLYTKKIISYECSQDALRDLVAFVSNLEKKSAKGQKEKGQIDNDKYSQIIDDISQRYLTNSQVFLRRVERIKKLIEL
jgi:hypothetical protein